MTSGYSGRNNSGSKGFDFAATDDILCSYEDYANQDTSNGTHSDPGIVSNSSKEFHKSRMARSSMFPGPAYNPPEEFFNQDVISTVDKTMKKYTDNLMRFLEGISSRLSQLELYCYNVDKSIGEMRSDLVRDNEEADSKLKSLEKHLQEVRRSVQILKDKQELAEKQNELAKLQLAQKESSSSNTSQQNDDRATPPFSDPKKTDHPPDMHSQQLALALPHQVAPQPSLPTRPLEQPQPVAPPPPPQSMPQSQTYYLSPVQMPNPPTPALPSQGQYLSSDSQYRPPQMQDISRVAPPQPPQSQLNQATQAHTLPQYQHQWPQQIRPPSTTVYPSYPPNQPSNPSPPELLPNSMPMQVPYSGISQPGGTHSEPMPYGYSGPGRTAQQLLPQLKNPYGVQLSDGYTSSGGNAYVVYEGESGQKHHLPQQPHFPQGGYPPTSVPLQGPQPNPSPSHLGRPSQFSHNHPYNELMEKLVNMGCRGDHVASMIQRMEGSGQPVDFNSVLDSLNGHSSGAPQRGWSG